MLSRMKKVPHRQALMLPVLQAISDLGGSASVEEIRDKVTANLNIPDEIQSLPYISKRGSRDGRTEIEYNLAWARTDLKQLGLIENSKRGVWAITSAGTAAQQSDSLFKQTSLPLEPSVTESQDWRSQLSQILVEKLSPSAFERLVQRILRETGFAQVEVTGRTGDGGIDGRGIARINGILSFRVVFQCKRYQGGVSSSAIRDFRGAMQGRADKGLFITTGYFTRDAVREATRDGAIAIDLVDGEHLADKLRELNLGVRIETVERAVVEPAWFETL